MEKIVCSLITLHNLCIEERLEKADELSEEKKKNEDSFVAVRKERKPIWGKLLQLSASNTTSEPGTLAALRRVRRLVEEEARHALMNCLLV